MASRGIDTDGILSLCGAFSLSILPLIANCPFSLLPAALPETLIQYPLGKDLEDDWMALASKTVNSHGHSSSGGHLLPGGPLPGEYSDEQTVLASSWWSHVVVLFEDAERSLGAKVLSLYDGTPSFLGALTVQPKWVKHGMHKTYQEEEGRCGPWVILQGRNRAHRGRMNSRARATETGFSKAVARRQFVCPGVGPDQDGCWLRTPQGQAGDPRAICSRDTPMEPESEKGQPAKEANGQRARCNG